MKILLINTYDQGGAAIACQRLHLRLLEEGENSKLLLGFKTKNFSKSFVFQQTPPKPFFFKKIKTKAKFIFEKFKLRFSKSGNYRSATNSCLERDEKLEMYSLPCSNYDITISPLYQEADIINLHWVANFLDYESFFKKNKKPVVWTLHDMNPFLGIDHYAEQYLGIDESGFPKKRKISTEERKFSKYNLKIKKEALERVDNLTIVAPSKWLAKMAEESELFAGKKILHIPNGIDPKEFFPEDRYTSRELFNIPKEKKVILFVADSLKKNRKGFMFLKKAFEQLEGNNFELCVVGNIESSWENRDDVTVLGKIDGEKLMRAAYSAADLFVVPSILDNLPNTVLEAIMCGTPVVGFPVGGIPDIISRGKNGLVSEEISVASLRNTILQFFNSFEDFNGEKIREDAIKRFNTEIQAKRYISLFKSILESDRES